MCVCVCVWSITQIIFLWVFVKQQSTLAFVAYSCRVSLFIAIEHCTVWKTPWFIYSSQCGSFWGVHISRPPFTEMRIEWGLSLPRLQWNSNKMSCLCPASATCGGEVLPWWRMQAHGTHCVVSSVLPWPQLLFGLSALLCCPSCLDPPLPRLLWSPQEGERAVLMALHLSRLLWLWSHSGGHGLVIL